MSILPKDLRRGGRELGELVARKNVAYGSSFARAGEFLKLLYPAGIQPEQFTDALLLVRIFDKQMRIATSKGAFGESPYRDIAGYGLLGAANDEANPSPDPLNVEGRLKRLERSAPPRRRK